MMVILLNSLTNGGAERVALTLLDEIRAMGTPVKLVCLEREQVYEIPAGVQVHYLTRFENLSNPFWKTLWVFIAAYRLSRFIKKNEVSFVQSHLTRSNFINAAAKLFGARHQAQLVTHNTLELYKDPWLLRKLKGAFYSWLFRKAEEVVSISKMMKKEAEEVMHLKRRLIRHRVIHNPHDLVGIRSLAGARANGFDFQAGKFYIVFAGRLVRLKRMEILIEAMREVKTRMDNVELIILGEGELKCFYQKEVRRLDLENCVHFLGHISNPFAYLSRSHLFVLPSEKEGLPNVIVEALACGLPVISSDCISGPREILSPDSDIGRQLSDHIELAKYGVLVPVGRADLLAEAILELLANVELRMAYARSGRQRAQDFDKKVIAARFVEPFINELSVAKAGTPNTI